MGMLSILCHRPGQVSQPLSASIPQPCHNPGLSAKTMEPSPANCPEAVAAMPGTRSALCSHRNLCVFAIHSTPGEKWVWIPPSLLTKTPRTKDFVNRGESKVRARWD